MKVKCGKLEYTTYLLYRSEIETADICHNARSSLCAKCEEPECECAGRVYPKEGK